MNRLSHQCSIDKLRKQYILGIALLNDIYYYVQNLGFSVIEITFFIKEYSILYY